MASLLNSGDHDHRSVSVITLLTCMQSHVGFKMVVSGEPLVTFLTLEWFLAGVSSLVVL